MPEAAPRSPGLDHPHVVAALMETPERLRTVFQPIVDLSTDEPLGYEALARGPVGHPLERPDRLFAAASTIGRVRDLDVGCQVAAIERAVDGGLGHPQWLFLNGEPETLSHLGADLLSAYELAARSTLPLVIEVTERAVTAEPAELLRALERVRDTGARIAMDDIGADARALALLPLVRPDVIKLDLRLVQQQPTRAIARIVNAVNAEAERSGAAILAEGIETEEHLATALAMGATLGQGWRFGRPGPLPPTPCREVVRGLMPVARIAAPPTTPFEACADGRPVRTGRKDLLIEMSKHLEHQARAVGELGVLLSTFQEARNLTPATVTRYRDLAGELAFVAAIGEGLPAVPLPGVRGAELHPDDPVRGEWDVVVLGPHFAAALTARDLGDDGPDHRRRFAFVLTYDRSRVLAAARSLLERVWGEAHQTTPTPAADGPTSVADHLGERLPTAADHLGERLPTAADHLGDRRPVGAHHHLDAGPVDADTTELVDGRPGSCPRPLRDPSPLHLRALAASVNGVTIAEVTGDDHPLVYVNDGFERLTGYRAADILGLDCRFLQGPDTDPAAIRQLSRAVRSRRGGRVRLLNHRADGTPWWNDVTISPVHDDAGRVTHFIGVQSDVTAEVEAERRLNHLAFHDELTGLPNRRALFDRLVDELSEVRDRGRALAVVFVDLDGFKAVNDRYGHEQGDEVLREITRRLRGAVRDGDTVARQHGDEFVLVLPDVRGNIARAAGRVADEVLRRLAVPIELPAGPVTVTGSVGVALAPADGEDADTLLRAADRAMYDAKLAGRARAVFASSARLAHTPAPTRGNG